MSDIITERSGSVLEIQLNRPAKKNAITSGMYVGMALVLLQSNGRAGAMTLSASAPSLSPAQITIETS